MDFIKKNRPAAAIILVFVIIFSVVLGTFRSVSGIKSNVEREYNKKDSYGETVSGTVAMLEMHIRTFVSEYEAVLGDCGEASVLKEYAEAIRGSNNGIVSGATDVDEMRNCAVLMHQRLDRLDDSTGYPTEAKTAYAGIDNDISILKKYDSYNTAAKALNDLSESFIGKLFGVGRAVEF